MKLFGNGDIFPPLDCIYTWAQKVCVSYSLKL